MLQFWQPNLIKTAHFILTAKGINVWSQNNLEKNVKKTVKELIQVNLYKKRYSSVHCRCSSVFIIGFVQIFGNCLETYKKCKNTFCHRNFDSHFKHTIFNVYVIHLQSASKIRPK